MTSSFLRIFPKTSPGHSLWFLVFVLAFFSTHTAQAQTLPSKIVLTAGDYSETLSATELSSWFHLTTVIVRNPQRKSEAENTASCPVNLLFCDFSLSRAARNHMAVHFESTVDHESVNTFVTALADQVDQDPQDAVFGTDADQRVIVATPEKLGRKLNITESTALILRALGGESTDPVSVVLTTDIAQPNIVAADRERLGLKELIGEGRTNFKGSPKNRIYNINRALKQFQNILIAPGEEFSFVKYLGEVDGEHGYLPELVIKNNQTTPEFGGGICQVSTTVFRAAIYSGLKITERHNHAYPVSYYKPYGMDATIYIPKPDLKFTNNTPGAIFVQSTIEGNDLIFDFFGSKDGRTVTVDGPHTLAWNPDGSMKTVFTQAVSNADGQNFIRDSFYSNYKSPSLFPHPGQEPVYTSKPSGWSDRQWKEYKALHP